MTDDDLLAGLDDTAWAGLHHAYASAEVDYEMNRDLRHFESGG